MQDYLPDEKTYVLDEALVWDDLWVSAHVWAEPWTGDREVGWINFRLVEWDAEGDGPLYPTDPNVRGAARAQSPEIRDADPLAEGFLKWDGCMEIDMDHHMCGIRNYQKVATAILRLFLWAGTEHGFENCEMEEPDAADQEG